MRRLFIAITFLCGLWLLPTNAAADCSFSVTPLSFGKVLYSGGPLENTATVAATCNLYPPGTVIRVCPDIGAGSGGSSETSRQLLNGASALTYQLYQDPSHSVIWGSNDRAPLFTVTMGLVTGSATRTLYGHVPAGQSALPAGSYTSSFAGTRFRYLVNNPVANCNSLTGFLLSNPVNFTVSATIDNQCLVSTRNIDFGKTGVLNSNINGTGSVSVTCTRGVQATVALGPGNAWAGSSGRKMFKGAESVRYQLYSDASRTKPWGDTATETVAQAGTGSAQTLQVYGRVPQQATPSPGVYSDTINVTVTY